MKHIKISLAFLLAVTLAYGQLQTGTFQDPYFRLIEGSENSGAFRSEVFSDLDTSWNKWKLKGYYNGFDPSLTPMFTTVNGILSTPYMIQVRGNTNEKNKKRWGFHVFEGYASDDKSRITMLVNKHVEEDRPVAEMYYYSSLWGHSNPAYYWFRIGSDVRQHSFMFGRDKAIFYGSLHLSNTLTLGNLGREDLRKDPPPGDDETNYKESAKHVNYKALRESENGSVFYDRDHDMVVIKINGEWMKLAVEALPDSIRYDF
jgi:hypothetical protein